jgi:hypothetical protein
MHVVEALVDIFQCSMVSHIFVHFQLALHIIYEGMLPVPSNLIREHVADLQRGLEFRYGP